MKTKFSTTIPFGLRAAFLFCLTLLPFLAQAQNPVTFQVNMSVQTSAGAFNPATMTVEARGAFNSFAGGFTLTNSPGDTNIYSGTFDVPEAPASSVAYKFVFNNGGTVNWESPATTGGGDRTFIVAGGAQTLPVVFFSDSTGLVPVTFQVNMAVQAAGGAFNPATMTAEARGAFNGWSSGFTLTNSPGNTNVYSGTYPVPNTVGSSVAYKFVINNGGAANWESPASTGGGDRTFILQSTAQTLPVVFFADTSFADILSADTLVTFRVNMAGAVGTDSHTFDTNSGDGVYLNGAFIPWWTWISYPPDYKMADDGTLGDAMAGDSIFTWQRLFLKGAATRVEYKYGINSIDDEAGQNTNHVRYINGTGAYVMPLDTFGTMIKESGPATNTLGTVMVGLAGTNINLAWTGGAGIYLQGASSLTSPSWLTLSNTVGLSTTTVPHTNNARYFRLIKP